MFLNVKDAFDEDESLSANLLSADVAIVVRSTVRRMVSNNEGLGQV